MKSSIASLLIASTIFITDIDAVVHAEEPEAAETSETVVTNENVQMENSEEAPAESTEMPVAEEETTEPSAEAVEEDVLVSSTPENTDEDQIREAAIEAHSENDESDEAPPALHESQESDAPAEPSSEQPETPPLPTEEESTVAPEPTEEATSEPVTEEAPTTEPTEEAPTAEETIEETNQPPTVEVPVQESEEPAADEPVMEPVEPSVEVPAQEPEKDDNGFVPYPEAPEAEHTSVDPEPSEPPAAEKKKYFRYDYGNILEGISLRPGASETELGLLDKRVNRLMSARIMEESEVDEAVIYEIEEKVKNEEGVTASTSREELPNTGETTYTFLYGTVLFISGGILLCIMRKPKHNK
ncbi:hypothetical protein FO441_09105 [Salinicoccus cyprini]|uniref:LPXTG cell wall anchor domain-containing protein n=2 Tax=Staphylococcaceae TaxID=90964 RepID=A0A558AUA8_9STAP|nr:hypothetical protein FO441_09105 [Salinicoccus cyprini]